MPSRRALLVGLAALAAQPSRACGFDGALDAGFGYVHPRALEVALAVRQAVVDGALDADALEPLTPGAEGLWRATGQLRLFGQALSATRTPFAPRRIALLLAEASLWTRYTLDGEKYDCLVHAAGPEGDDVVLVTDRAVLQAVNAGRLSCARALSRSLIVIDAADPAPTTALLAAIAPVRETSLEARGAWGSAH